MKFCKDCANCKAVMLPFVYELDYSGALCLAPENYGPRDMVSGNPKLRYPKCSLTRVIIDGGCGPDAKWFKPIPEPKELRGTDHHRVGGGFKPFKWKFWSKAA